MRAVRAEMLSKTGVGFKLVLFFIFLSLPDAAVKWHCSQILIKTDNGIAVANTSGL